MNLASALIKRVLECEDFDTWMNVRKHYLPNEYHALFDIISKHSDIYHKLPKVEELKLEIRDSATLDKVYALESIETEAEPFLLLDYLKNEYAQKEVLFQIDKWIDSSVAFESAEEVVRHIQQIGIDLEAKVELTPAEESMQRINLFESEEEMGKRITLGLNNDFDAEFDFRASDYFMIGGKRGAGKSLTLSNIGNHTVEKKKKKFLYFTIEMEAREVLQRACAIATSVPFTKIRNKNLSITEWERIVQWWATRYQDSEADVKAYFEHRDFNRFHQAISRKDMSEAFVDIVYDPNLTLGRIHAEVEKRAHDGTLGGVGIDYLNQVRRTSGYSANGQYDWKEQIEISKAFKNMSQVYRVPFGTAYQIDAAGEARFSKGILDAADMAMTLDAHEDSMTFKVTKMRGARDDAEFTSKVEWNCLQIGPENGTKPEPKKSKDTIGTLANKGNKENIYDDQDAPF